MTSVCPVLNAPHRPALTPPHLVTCCLVNSFLLPAPPPEWSELLGWEEGVCPPALSSVTGMLAKATEHLHHPRRVISPQDQPPRNQEGERVHLPIAQVRKLRHRDARSLEDQTAHFICQKRALRAQAALWARKGMGKIFMLCVTSFRNEPWTRGQAKSLGINTIHLGPRKAQKKPSFFNSLRGWGTGFVFPSACGEK